MRKGTIDLLRKKGFNMWVVCPTEILKEPSIDPENQVISIPYSRKGYKLKKLLQHFGFIEDYFDSWAELCVDYLASRINKEDIVFSTLGGETSTIKIGHSIKKKTGCRFIANYRDPINYASYKGLTVPSGLPHRNRNRIEEKYISNADHILTSSKTFESALKSKYPNLKDRIQNNSFGYISQTDSKHTPRTERKTVRVVYGGNFSAAQKPETILNVMNDPRFPKHVEFHFIGNHSQETKSQFNSKNVHFHEAMSRNEYLSFLINEADIGLASLFGEYYGYCVPSKIYEYINVCLPILGCLPNGEAQNIINSNNYGRSASFDDTEALTMALLDLCNDNTRALCHKALVRDRELWSMSSRLDEITHLFE